MRKLTAGLFHSVDGVVEAPDQWQFDAFDDELGALLGKVMASVDTVLLGRKGYEEWAGYWPGKTAEDDPYAPFINDVHKYVVSTTLTTLEWEPSTLISSDVAERVRELKEQPGKKIGISGSITLIGSLLTMGLLDELRLLVFPVVGGSGKRLFEGNEQVPLRLVETKTFQTGVLSLTHEGAEA